MPKRLSAVELIARSWSSFVGHRTSFTPSVSIGPGEMQFTRMPYGAHSIASVRERLITPALAAP